MTKYRGIPYAENLESNERSILSTAVFRKTQFQSHKTSRMENLIIVKSANAPQSGLVLM